MNDPRTNQPYPQDYPNQSSNSDWSVNDWGTPADWGGTASDGYPEYAGYSTGYETLPQRSFPIWIVIILGLIMMIIILALGGGVGYFSGVRERKSAEATEIVESLRPQYDLALQDIQGGRYEIAQQRLEYVLKYKPDFPGAVQKLTEAKMARNLTLNVPAAVLAATAPPEFTPSPSSTPDTRGSEEVYKSAQAALAGKDWNTAIDLLLRMRREAPEFNSVRVDGMLYIAYRNRGIDKILKETKLEGGTYDFSLAERYGPLDAEAQNYRDWVNLYTVGASFWDIDWGQAASYFGQLAPMAPQLRDASGWSAVQRYQIALGKYADQLVAKEDYCRAVEQLNIAVQSGAANYQPTAVYVQNLCSPPAEATPVPTPGP